MTGCNIVEKITEKVVDINSMPSLAEQEENSNSSRSRKTHR